MNKNKKIVVWNGALWAGYRGLTSVFLVAFALALGASNTVIGLLGALPFIAALFTQFLGANLVQRYPRRKIYVAFALPGRLFWIPILLTPFFFTNPLIFVVIFYLFCQIGEYITEPALVSMLGDIVEEKGRGDFISYRFRIQGAVGMVAMVLGGLWLKQFPKESPVGFAIMFGLGAVLAVLSTLVVGRIEEPKYQDHQHHSIKEFFTLSCRLKSFVTFNVIFNFGHMLAGPLISVYMLKNLDISYDYYGLTIGILTIAQITGARYIGRITDRFGDKPVALLGLVGVSLIPLIWLTVTKNNLWLIVPVQIFVGLSWAALDISRLNLLLDLTDRNKRAMQMAEFVFYSSIPLAIAPILGGWMSEHFTFILVGIPLVFVLASLIRLVSGIFLVFIKEPRAKKEYTPVFVLEEAMHIHPERGISKTTYVIKKLAFGLGIIK